MHFKPADIDGQAIAGVKDFHSATRTDGTAIGGLK
jgi:hypothetical protein